VHQLPLSIASMLPAWLLLERGRLLGYFVAQPDPAARLLQVCAGPIAWV
jgi:hypothetical protein